MYRIAICDDDLVFGSLSFRQVIRCISAELPGSVKRQKAGLHVIL